MIILVGIGALFIVLGFVIKAASDSVVEYSVQYDGAGAAASAAACALPANSSGATRACTLTIQVAVDMPAPVFVYYELDNFFQNHRRYVKSRSDTQLAGTFAASASDPNVADCAPLVTTTAADGTTKLLHPCGLIAMSFFNDTFALASAPTAVTMSETGIAWATDVSTKFKPSLGSYARYSAGVQFLNDSYPRYNSTTAPIVNGASTLVRAGARPAARARSRRAHAPPPPPPGR